MQKIRNYEILSSKWDIYITILPPRFSNHHGRGSKKIVRARNRGDPQRIVLVEHGRVIAHRNS